MCRPKSSCELFPLAITHAKVVNNNSGKMVIARYRIRYFFQNRAAVPLTLVENYLFTVARYFSSLLPPSSDFGFRFWVKVLKLSFGFRFWV